MKYFEVVQKPSGQNWEVPERVKYRVETIPVTILPESLGKG